MFKNLIPGRGEASEATASSGTSTEMSTIEKSLNQMLSEFWNPDAAEDGASRWSFDVEDSEDQMTVRAEIPGFEPQDIDVQLSGNRLIVQAEHQTETTGNGKRSQYGKVYRSMTVPAGIEADKIEANYKNGVLEVRLPKGAEARAKRITVKSK